MRFDALVFDALLSDTLLFDTKVNRYADFHFHR